MVFNDSKYTRWYNQIIEQAKVRILPRDVYVEKHHIEETLAKVKVPKPKLQCQHCKKVVGGQANLVRWHNDNCKLMLGELKFHA